MTGALDFADGHCIGIPFFTELPVKQQLDICHEGDGCPVMDACTALGLTEPIYAKDDLAVYGGLHPRVRWELSRRKKARR